jgi:hypothetical protein
MGKAAEKALGIECPRCKVPKDTYCTKGGLVRRPTKGFLHAERVQKACW